MLPSTRLDKLPRMADFALWATACETASWPAGTFWSAYCGNRKGAAEDVLEGDLIATAVRALMAKRAEWAGTATELLCVLTSALSEQERKSKAWPDSPRALAGRLRRTATFLREAGIQISFDREGHARTRVIRITKASENAPSAPSASAATLDQPNPPKGFAALGARTIANDADATAEDAPHNDRPHQALAIKR